MTRFIKRMYWLLSVQGGFDLRRLLKSLRGIPRFIVDWWRFRRDYSGRLNLFPCLHDWYEEGGTARGEYFWQDLHVAQQIHRAAPRRHVDIGSRFDGFVAHLASFREVEVFDIRPITAVVPNVSFKQANLMNPDEALIEYCDSLSCLHALEHFGLGRYGDPIDPQGAVAGLKNMARLLKSGGVFYLSVPSGVERVEFNAHRIFDPQKLVKMAADQGLILTAFASMQPGGELLLADSPQIGIAELVGVEYALGIYTFVKS